MPDTDTREQVAKEIAADLFTNGLGQRARRMVLELEGGGNGGGWCEGAVVDRIRSHLASPPAPVEGEREPDAWLIEYRNEDGSWSPSGVYRFDPKVVHGAGSAARIVPLYRASHPVQGAGGGEREGRFSFDVFWSDEDRAYVAALRQPSSWHFSGIGATPLDAMRELMVPIDMALEDKAASPAPSAPEEEP